MTKSPIEMQMALQKAIEAEWAVLGVTMLRSDNAEVLATVMDSIDDPDFFYQPVHQDIFKAILDLYNAGEPTDVISVNNWLKENNLFEKVRSINYLNGLTECASLPSQLSHHVKIVVDAALRRKTEAFGVRLADFCRKPGQTIDEILLSAEKGLVEIGNASRGDKTLPLGEIMPAVRDDIEKRKKGEACGLFTGYKDLDNKTDGFHSGELIILAARPSMGKSALALNIAENLIRDSIPVGLISLEMKNLENAKRLVVSRAKAALPKGEGSTISDEGWNKIDRSISELDSAPLYMNDQTDMTITRLKSIATKMRLNYKIELLIVDYLQLLSCGRYTPSKNEEISIISRSLKTLAGTLHIPILAVSQFSRAIESRGPKAKPKLSDLRDSGAIEQDGDIVLFIHPAKPDGGKDEINAELIIAKSRNGPRGSMKLHFVKSFVRWEPGTW